MIQNAHRRAIFTKNAFLKKLEGEKNPSGTRIFRHFWPNVPYWKENHSFKIQVFFKNMLIARSSKCALLLETA